MLCTTARRKSPAAPVHRQQRGDRSAARRLAENRDPVRVAAEGPDVVAHPLAERRPGRADPGWRGAPSMLREALDADAVVERHHDDAAVPREPTAVVLGEAGHADHVRAALDPHHDRQPGARVGSGDQTLTVSQSSPAASCDQRVHAEMPALRGRRAVREGLPHPAPGRVPVAARAKRNAPTGGSANGMPRKTATPGLPAAAQPPARRTDFGPRPGWLGLSNGHRTFFSSKGSGPAAAWTLKGSSTAVRMLRQRFSEDSACCGPVRRR